MYQDQGHMGLIAAVIGQEAMDPLDRLHIYGRVNTDRHRFMLTFTLQLLTQFKANNNTFSHGVSLVLGQRGEASTSPPPLPHSVHAFFLSAPSPLWLLAATSAVKHHLHFDLLELDSIINSHL